MKLYNRQCSAFASLHGFQEKRLVFELRRENGERYQSRAGEGREFQDGKEITTGKEAPDPALVNEKREAVGDAVNAVISEEGDKGKVRYSDEKGHTYGLYGADSVN